MCLRRSARPRSATSTRSWRRSISTRRVVRGIQFLTRGADVRRTRQEFDPAVRHARHLDARRDAHLRAGPRAAPRTPCSGRSMCPGHRSARNGETMLVDPDEGDRVVIRGTVTDVDGKPIAGAMLDCWQNVAARFLRRAAARACSTPENLRGIYTTDDDGTYEIRTVRPVPYPIPSDGPVGDAAQGQQPRGWMRPGHTHMWAAGPRLQGPDHPRVRRRERPPPRRRRVRRPREPDRARSARRRRRAGDHVRLRARARR